MALEHGLVKVSRILEAVDRREQDTAAARFSVVVGKVLAPVDVLPCSRTRPMNFETSAGLPQKT